MLVFAISLGIQRMSATLALGLFFVYAASLGLTVGLIVRAYTDGSVVTAFLSRVGDVRCRGRLRPRHEALARRSRRLPVMGVIGLLVATPDQPVPAQ